MLKAVQVNKVMKREKFSAGKGGLLDKNQRRGAKKISKNIPKANFNESML